MGAMLISPCFARFLSLTGVKVYHTFSAKPTFKCAECIIQGEGDTVMQRERICRNWAVGMSKEIYDWMFDRAEKLAAARQEKVSIDQASQLRRQSKLTPW